MVRIWKSCLWFRFLQYFSTTSYIFSFHYLEFYTKCPTHVLTDYSKICASEENPRVSRRKSDLVPAIFVYLWIWHLEKDLRTALTNHNSKGIYELSSQLWKPHSEAQMLNVRFEWWSLSVCKGDSQCVNKHVFAMSRTEQLNKRTRRISAGKLSVFKQCAAFV